MEVIFENAFIKGFEKIDYMISTLTGFPHTTKNGIWLENTNGHWTGGFWTGLIWLHYVTDKNEKLLHEGLSWAKKLAVRRNDNTTHDQGFIFGPSCILGYHITGDVELKELACAGAKNMLDLYDKNVALVRAWAETDYQRIAIVDTAMNLPIMIWASDRENNPAYRETGISTMDTIDTCYIREDFSTFHIVKWDDQHNIAGGTHQGYSAESCWSRGQAWAFYGFANMYRYTKNEHYLEQAKNLAIYFINHLDDDCLAKWDFCFKNDKNSPIDSSACAIAASGLILLSGLCSEKGDRAQSKYFRISAEDILKSLIINCLYKKIDRFGILEEATVDLPRNSGINESTMYGDYYFMEALYRLKNEDNKDRIELLY